MYIYSKSGGYFDVNLNDKLHESIGKGELKELETASKDADFLTSQSEV